MLIKNLDLMTKRVGYYGDSISADQWTRMREDKLRSLKKSLYYSYQAAIVQKYNINIDSKERQLVAIATKLEKIATLTEEDRAALQTALAALEQEYLTLAQIGDRYSQEYLSELRNIIAQLSQTEPYFRCLINHDKLKVDYQDKVISIPFEQNSVSIDPVKDNKDLLETGFHNGTVFKWVHGNKQEWVPDTYWIVYMQYSEQTAYFRGQIRKADEEISIVIVNPDGSESQQTYRGWMTGPNETTALWNVKKGVVWNDLNYTKLLYITKDENTLAFFQRFDRININGKPWEVVAYNENYGTSSSNTNTGIIRVALKETYTSTDQQIKEFNKEQQTVEATILGPDTVSPYDENIIYEAKNAAVANWEVLLTEGAAGQISDYVSYTIDGNKLILSVVTTKAYRKGFNIKYGDLVKHITIKSL